MKIIREQNFLRLFRIPKQFPDKFCFGSGILTEFLMVDWFNPLEERQFFGLEKIDYSYQELEDLTFVLIELIKTKEYYRPDFKYIAITDFNYSFII